MRARALRVCVVVREGGDAGGNRDVERQRCRVAGSGGILAVLERDVPDGEVVDRGGQVDPQPRAAPVRPATEPLRGATVTDFKTVKPNA